MRTLIEKITIAKNYDLTIEQENNRFYVTIENQQRSFPTMLAAESYCKMLLPIKPKEDYNTFYHSKKKSLDD
jgi:hypothetical protein